MAVPPHASIVRMCMSIGSSPCLARAVPRLVADFDIAAVSPSPTLDGEMAEDVARDDRLHREVGRYLRQIERVHEFMRALPDVLSR